MSTRVCVGTTIKNVSSINTFVNGQRREITSAWTFVNGQIKQLWPNTETWTLVASWKNGESFSAQFGWGKYLVQMSGGAGAGSSIARRTGDEKNRLQGNGSNAERIETSFSVPQGQTYTFSGRVGTGASGSTTTARTSYSQNIVGNPGTGYQDGGSGTKTHSKGVNSNLLQLAGGSGGGSTSVFLNNNLWLVARGGNGGGASILYYERSSTGSSYKWNTYSASGGAGGSGGVTSGSGATGGAFSYGTGDGSYNVSGAGANGYVYIYKSNIYPT